MMVLTCNKHKNPYGRDRPRPRWQRWCVYGFGSILILYMLSFLRDTTPVHFNHPNSNDLDMPRAEMATQVQLNDVYWRMSVRYVADMLSEVCQRSNYTVLTQKNIKIGGTPMAESYIFICGSGKNGHTSVLNARSVISQGADKVVQCVETYANITKRVRRKYPFSVKYVSSETFTPRTKVIRNPGEACIWQHALDIIESVWD
jgi:hypothetical protein